MDSIHKTLKNKLNVVLVPMPHLHLVNLTMFVRVGSRFEHKRTNGLGHLLEHILIRKPKEHIEALGGQLQAEVAKEFSFYQIAVLPEHLKQGFSILYKMLRQPEFDPETIQIEKKIVQEESLEYKGENGADIDLDELSAQLLWPDTNLAFKIQGEIEQIRKYNKKDLQRYWRQFYVSNNMLLCVVGNFDTNQCQSLIKDLFGDWRRGIPAKTKTIKIKQTKPQYRFVQQPTSQIRARLTYRAFSYRYSLLIALELLENIVNARLEDCIRAKQGLVYNINSHLSTFADVGALNIDFKVSPDKLVNVIKAIIRLKGQKLTSQELNKAKLLVERDLKFSLDKPEEITDMFGLDELLACFKSPEEKLQEIKQATIGSIQKLAQQIFVPKNLNLVVVGPCSNEQKKRVRTVIQE